MIGGADFASSRGGRALTPAELAAWGTMGTGANMFQHGFTPPPGYTIFGGTPDIPLDNPILLPIGDQLVTQTGDVGFLQGLTQEALPQFLQGPGIPLGAAAGVGALSAAGMIPAGEVAGMGSGAAGGASVGASTAGGGMDLGGGLSVDEFGNVTGGMFQGGPGTAGAGDFFSGGASGADFGGAGGAGGMMNMNNAGVIASLARALGIGGGAGAAAGGAGAGAGAGQGGGFNLGQLLPLLGIGSGLNTMFNRQQAVDPARVDSLWQAGQNTYNLSRDPQNQLHDFLQQQTVDNSRAGTSARGIGMSGNSAGIENDATRNFNMDWQNQQLARQAQGTQAFAGAGQGAAQAGLANNAQAFTQNQTGMNNLTTGLGQVFGNGGLFGSGGGGAGGVGSWLTSMFGGGAGAAPAGTSYDSGGNYNSAGSFNPYYTGTDASGGAAYG